MLSEPNQVDPTMRIVLFTSITSAPASRISSTASSRTPASTAAFGSAIRIRIPGPWAGAVPARMDSSVEVLFRLFAGHPLGIGT